MKELLEKWQRLGMGMSLMNREAHFQALSAVKPTIIAYVAKLVDGMNDDEVKEFKLFSALCTIRKIQPDSYSGTLKDNLNTIVHVFDKVSIPQLAGQVQSFFELYSEETPEDKATEEYASMNDKLKAQSPEDGLVSQLMEIFNPSNKPDQKEIADITNDAIDLSHEIREQKKAPMSADSLQELKEKVENMLARVESVVANNAPIKAKDDETLQSLKDFKDKHNDLVERAQIELNVLHDKIEELKQKIEETESSSKAINIHIHG